MSKKEVDPIWNLNWELLAIAKKYYPGEWAGAKFDLDGDDEHVIENEFMNRLSSTNITILLLRDTIRELVKELEKF